MVAGISPVLRAQITEIICSQKPVNRIILFGSRARGKARRTSDIDLAVDGNGWTDQDVNLVHNRLEEEVPTALKFDLVNVSDISRPELKKEIFENGKTIYER
ncbi:MAG TPA: nucleotidyltransferase domain-containing protein [Kiritimatiellia bacterium]|nr:nucleotidyltransferase domain-containing protein [Kiritimatiellia bacterium]HPA77345.1 nucleotidyltransferase domain-containing protein [Kiritimatiellia bacterium]